MTERCDSPEWSSCSRRRARSVAGRAAPWATLTAVTLERAIRLQSIAATLGALRPMPADVARRMLDDKYRDRFVDEYWQAWLRNVG